MGLYDYRATVEANGEVFTIDATLVADTDMAANYKMHSLVNSYFFRHKWRMVQPSTVEPSKRTGSRDCGIDLKVYRVGTKDENDDRTGEAALGVEDGVDSLEAQAV